MRISAVILPLADLLDYFDHNPLPAVIMVTPLSSDPVQLPLLQAELQALPGVNEAQLDMEWVQRLNAIIALAKRGSYVLGRPACNGGSAGGGQYRAHDHREPP